MMIKEDERRESRKEPTEDFAKGDFTSPNVEEVSQRGEASGQHIGASETRRFLQRVHSGNYETTTSLEQDLTFETTTRIFKEHFLDLEEGRQRILGLTDDEGYTNLAYMLSDQFTASIKVAAYVDDSMTAFTARRIFRGSVLGQLRDVLEFIELNNRLSSEIIGYKRQDTWQFPPTAIREAVINAIIHRDYAMDGSTIVHILPDRICITSPGSLNECYSVEDLRLGVSSSRNPLLADVFYRLEYCETYGSGIPRIIDCYKGLDQPEIVVGDSVFHVCLPATDTRRDPLDRLLGSRDSITRSDIEKEGYSKTEALSMIDSLIRSGRIVRHGGGRSTRYLVQNR